MTDSRAYPEHGSCYCLNEEHAERASEFKSVFHYQHGDHLWDNPEKKTRHRDITESIRIVTAEATSTQRALGSLNAFSFSEFETSVNKGFHPYVLKRSSHNILPQKRLKTYTISNVVYDWSRLERPTATPRDMPTLMIDNYSRSRQSEL